MLLMVRLRQLGSEFRHPDEIATGAQMTMPYIRDMQAYQDYIDGDLSQLYARMAGGERVQDLTGAAYYAGTDNKGYFEVNFFLAVNRTVVAAVFESDPKPLLGDDPNVDRAWKEYGPKLIKAARKGVEWRAPKGRSIWVLEKRYPDKLELIAWDPQYYIPFTDYVDRDLTLGHILWRPWWSGPRVLQHDFPDRVTFSIFIDEEGRENSERRLPVMNQVREFGWGGTLDAGVASFTNLPRLGDNIRNLDGVRIQKIWTNGDDDSIFKTMERTVYEAILALSNARTALTQDVRQILIAPRTIGEANLDEQGRVKLDRWGPQYDVSVDNLTGADVLGYVDPPGPRQAEAFRQLYDLCLDNLAYVANMPRESFGLGIRTNESGVALTKLQQTFKTMVIDVRDDLSKVLSEAFEAMTGIKTVIGWEHEPYTLSQDLDRRTLAYHQAGLISDATAQNIASLPIEQITPENNSSLRRMQGRSEQTSLTATRGQETGGI